jgi:hypothetical protein
MRSSITFTAILVPLCLGCAGEGASTEYDVFASGEESLAIERLAGSDEITVSHELGGRVRTVKTSAAALAADRAELDALIDGVGDELISEARGEVLARPTEGGDETELKACELAILGAGAPPDGDPGVLNFEQDQQEACTSCCWTSYAICYWGNVEHMGFQGAGQFCGAIYGCCC